MFVKEANIIDLVLHVHAGVCTENLDKKLLADFHNKCMEPTVSTRAYSILYVISHHMKCE